MFLHASTRGDAQGRPTSLALHGRGRGHHRHVPSVAPCRSCNYGNNGLQQPRKHPIDSNMTSINEHWAETQVTKAPGQAPATHDMRKCTYKQAKRRGGHPSGKQQCAPGLAPAASLASLWRRGLPQRYGWQETEGAGVAPACKRACGAGVCPSASASGERAVGEFLSLLSLTEVQIAK